jgi:ubiquinone/menaquinone biosynthesis C-methylase UbiE
MGDAPPGGHGGQPRSEQQPPLPGRGPSVLPPPAEKAAAVRRMFGAIAPRYDLLNHLLSLNIDRGWRRRAVTLLLDGATRRGGCFLDVCAGTLDFALALGRRLDAGGLVVGCDFALPMLQQGRRKLQRAPVRPACADALRLPFPDGTFDGATVGFGVRNLADLAAGLRELRRVLRPGASSARPGDSRCAGCTSSTSAACCRSWAGASPATTAPMPTCRRRCSSSPSRPGWRR